MKFRVKLYVLYSMCLVAEEFRCVCHAIITVPYFTVLLVEFEMSNACFIIRQFQCLALPHSVIHHCTAESVGLLLAVYC